MRFAPKSWVFLAAAVVTPGLWNVPAAARAQSGKKATAPPPPPRYDTVWPVVKADDAVLIITRMVHGTAHLIHENREYTVAPFTMAQRLKGKQHPAVLVVANGDWFWLSGDAEASLVTPTDDEKLQSVLLDRLPGPKNPRGKADGERREAATFPNGNYYEKTQYARSLKELTPKQREILVRVMCNSENSKAETRTAGPALLLPLKNENYPLVRGNAVSYLFFPGKPGKEHRGDVAHVTRVTLEYVSGERHLLLAETRPGKSSDHNAGALTLDRRTIHDRILAFDGKDLGWKRPPVRLHIYTTTGGDFSRDLSLETEADTRMIDQNLKRLQAALRETDEAHRSLDIASAAVEMEEYPSDLLGELARWVRERPGDPYPKELLAQYAELYALDLESLL